MPDARADEFVAHVERGLSLRQSEAETKLPATTFLRWCDENPELAERYARARAIADEAGFQGLDSMADEPPEKDQFGKVDAGWVAWQKMRIDTRKWTLARKHPTKYGDKQQVDQTITGSVTYQILTGIPDADSGN